MWLSLIVLAAGIPSAVRAQGGFNGPGRYEITNLKSGKVLAVDRNDQTGVIQFSPQNIDAQAWDIQAASSQGYYYFRSAMNGNALEAPGSRNSMFLRATGFSGGPSQQWRIERGKDGNALIVSANGKTLDVPDGSDRDGLRIQIYDLNGDSNQRFTFRRVSRGFFGRAPIGGAQTLQCASDDGRRHYCQADTRGGVRLSRQISGSPCRENETWGWDRNGIWVDRGCRAEFAVGAGQSSGGPVLSSVVRCSSDDGRRHSCQADTRFGVRLSRQISGSPCRQGETWGWDQNGIWVDRGCRADFEVGRR